MDADTIATRWARMQDVLGDFELTEDELREAAVVYDERVTQLQDRVCREASIDYDSIDGNSSEVI